MSNLFQNDLYTLDSLKPSLIYLIFKQAESLRKSSPTSLLKILRGKLAALLFYEPSSRTFSSFSSAMKRLGGQTIEYQNPLQTSSAVKGETIEDSAIVFSNYVDAIIVRHPETGTVKRMADIVSIPVINAGDGIGEHPTQALLDLYTIWRKHKSLDNLKGLMAGDLKNGRTIHSLLKGLSKFKSNTVYLLSPKELKLSEKDKKEYRDQGVTLIEITSSSEIPADCHYWYWTRVQKERFDDVKEYEKLKLRFILNKKLVNEKAGEKTLLMHPLPRVGEIAVDVDSDPRATYLDEQLKNGMYIRMALLKMILSK
ncbi:aspartate carbamoyltransferase [Candidatus Roizmanbacteria bacterium]|nr:aspartate carbamoyltransferase [Candidatus Roizmanbacteria bacterium]